MAFDTFLKIEGVEGESTDHKHRGEIEVLSYTWNVSQPATVSASSHGSLSAERADWGAFSVVKALDKASPILTIACASGQHFPSARLEICRAGDEKQPYMEYKMTDVLVTSVRPGGSSHGGETVPLEEINFSYGKIELKYTKLDMKGQPAGNVAAGWDLKANKKV